MVLEVGGIVGSYFPGHGTLIEETFLRGVTAGRIEERASLVLHLLEKRRIPTLASTRERISSCHDPVTLLHWVDEALTVTNAEELFDRFPEASRSTS
ncbi:hypothetical protein [Streptomyces tailanensis]|uniref:hypothetical protein n=1 Tax=Streptomyces tailanensis TaxID=2569858 RepID=UPI00122E2583|nr:hypothetical protein [Streptomyces tailanensis]